MTKRDKIEGAALFSAMTALGVTGLIVGGKFAALGMFALYMAIMFGLCVLSISRSNR